MKPRNYKQIPPVAKMLVDYFAGKVDDIILERITDSFVGIDSKMQFMMVKFFIDEYFDFNFPPLTNKEYTGVWHIDNMLVELLNMINEDMEKKENGYF